MFLANIYSGDWVASATMWLTELLNKPFFFFGKNAALWLRGGRCIRVLDTQRTLGNIHSLLGLVVTTIKTLGMENSFTLCEVHPHHAS